MSFTILANNADLSLGPVPCFADDRAAFAVEVGDQIAIYDRPSSFVSVYDVRTVVAIENEIDARRGSCYNFTFEPAGGPSREDSLLFVPASQTVLVVVS